ncbi:uncharacterized protein DFL_003926 [Arthrobotrys flagrans]|uniref:Uncharacterized protein n=1 Tax=Arthrobotrys flagrans TaxID=97331 RepID=A0A437A379_ARTFL|nr:hypothetical protein DFL_003926 [Arthrobotrys flagrans]
MAIAKSTKITKTPSKPRVPAKTPKPPLKTLSKASAKTPAETPRTATRASARIKAFKPIPVVVEDSVEEEVATNEGEESEVKEGVEEEEVEEEEAEEEEAEEASKSSKSKSKSKPKAKPKIPQRTSSRVPPKKRGRGIRMAEKEEVEGTAEEEAANEESTEPKSGSEAPKLNGVYTRARDLAKAGKIYPDKIAIGSEQPLRNLIAVDKTETTENSKRKSDGTDETEVRKPKKKKGEEEVGDGATSDDAVVGELDVGPGLTVDDTNNDGPGEAVIDETNVVGVKDEVPEEEKEEKKEKPELKPKSKTKVPSKPKAPSKANTKAPPKATGTSGRPKKSNKGRKYRRRIDRLIEEAKATNFGTKSQEWPASRTLRSGKRYSSK